MYLPEGANRKRFEREIEERLTGGPHVRFKTWSPALVGGWSPALNCGEKERSEGTKRFSVFFRVGGWWT